MAATVPQEGQVLDRGVGTRKRFSVSGVTHPLLKGAATCRELKPITLATLGIFRPFLGPFWECYFLKGFLRQDLTVHIVLAVLEPAGFFYCCHLGAEGIGT